MADSTADTEDAVWVEVDPEVDHPAHYAEGRRFEPIDVIEDWQLPMHLGNALKYISRAGRKDPTKTRKDLSKAVWYLQRYINRVLK